MMASKSSLEDLSPVIQSKGGREGGRLRVG